MPQRNHSTERHQVMKINKRVILPIPLDEYKQLISDSKRFREKLDDMIASHPELFPECITGGYVLHDILPASTKMPEVRFRRIKLKEKDAEGNNIILTIASSDVIPYMRGLTDEVEKALFLRRFGVPFWALAHVFGRDENYWYRLVGSLGRYSIVGTTIKDKEKLPEHLLADEKHTGLNGEKVYIATTVGEDCVLGASLALNADEETLTTAYGVFQAETKPLQADYQPKTVNTDGWAATQKAWRNLFPMIVIIHCFLHAFLKIRNRTKRFKELYPQIVQQVWAIYHAETPDLFRQRATDFWTWSQQHLTGDALAAVQKLYAKTDLFLLAFDFPDAYRTSNMIDRHMEPMARWVASTRFFHGHWAAAELQIRAWAILHNFGPYSPRARRQQEASSPAHKLNGFVYHENWLHNLLISTSCAGMTPLHRIRQN